MASRNTRKLILDHLIDLKAGRFVPARYVLFRLLHRPDHDQRPLRRAVRRAGPRRRRNCSRTFHMDVAASIQAVIEEVVLRLTRASRKQTGARNLCLAGGVALNCVANGKVLRDGAFDNIWIQPAAGDAGGALGRGARSCPPVQRPAAQARQAATACAALFSARSFSQADIERRLAAAGARFDGARRRRADRERPQRRSPSRRRSAGFRAGWSSGRARSAPARSWATRGRRHAEDPQPQGQIPRELPAVRARGAARRRRRLVRSRRRDSPYMLLVADVREGQAPRR